MKFQKSILILFVTLLLFSCKKEKEIKRESHSSVNTFYYNGYFGDQRINSEKNSKVTPVTASYSETFRDLKNDVYYDITFTSIYIDQTSLDIGFCHTEENYPVDANGKENYIGVGIYPLSKGGTERSNGVIIRYTDSNGKTWSTEHNSGEQPQHAFAVTEYEDIPYSFLHYDEKYIKMVFSCFLYDDDGNAKPIVIEEMKSYLIIYNLN